MTIHKLHYIFMFFRRFSNLQSNVLLKAVQVFMNMHSFVDIHVMNGSDYYTKDIAVNFLLNLIFGIPDKSIHVQQGIRTQMGKMYQI